MNKGSEMKKLTIVLSILVLFSGLIAEDLAQTPPMGWLSWNLFEGDINSELVKEIADAMVSSGMKEAGYEYIIIDDLWQGGRDEEGNILPDPDKFPNGIKPVADYVHEKGLKLGIYTDAAKTTCAGKVGSWGHVEQDINQFAEWGIDYVKVDYCWAPRDLFSAIERYKKFGDAIQNCGREMVFAVCEWGQRSPWLWGDSVGAQLWRTTWDIRDTWEHGQYDNGHNGIMEGLDRQVGLYRWAGPGRWNDMDMLVVGLYGEGSSASINNANGCTVTEYQSQMSLWSLLASPLLACCDIRNMDQDTKRILTNKEVIAINQDKLGKQARRIYKENEKEIWAKELENGAWAVGFLNRNDEKTVQISLDLAKIGFEKPAKSVRDVWQHKTVGKNIRNFKCKVEPHEVVLVRFEKK